MKPLIAVVNARHRLNWRTAVRSTWFGKATIDVRFFVGRGTDITDKESTIELDCSDRYEHLPEKVQAIAQWARQNGYTNVLKCDDDVVLKVRMLEKSDYYQYEFVGRRGRAPQPYLVPFGFCYWMGEKALSIVENAMLPEDGSNDDEKWVANNLYKNGINLHLDERYVLHCESYPEDNRRPLRIRGIVENYKAPFAWCVHTPGEQEDKIKEFYKIYRRIKET